MGCQTLALFLLLLTAGSLLNAGASPSLGPIGTVILASKAYFNAGEISAGTTVYDGDNLSTQEGGALQFKGQGASIYLPGASGITLYRLEKGTQVQLRIGTVSFSTGQPTLLEVLADGAKVRPLTERTTIGQVTVLGPKKLLVQARRGDLKFEYRTQFETIREGTSCRILLDSPDTPSSGPSRRTDRRQLVRDPPLFKIIVIGGIAWITEWGLHEVFESPDRP